MNEDIVKAKAAEFEQAQLDRKIDVYQTWHDGVPPDSITDLEVWLASPEGKAAIEEWLDEDGLIEPFEEYNPMITKLAWELMELTGLITPKPK